MLYLAPMAHRIDGVFVTPAPEDPPKDGYMHLCYISCYLLIVWVVVLIMWPITIQCYCYCHQALLNVK